MQQRLTSTLSNLSKDSKFISVNCCWLTNEAKGYKKIRVLPEIFSLFTAQQFVFSFLSSPALQKNFDRFDGLLNDFGHDSGRSVTPTRITPALIATCTALYSFRAQSARELSFNRGDVIRVHRVVDLNWLEGERNGQIGIFPSSYVQVNPISNGRCKRVPLIFYPRSIDTNWLEGVNNRGEIGIFPKTYVQEIRDSSSKLTT
uniref:SH3 domain-containing protein n=1 Tax=Parascaris equorum TaxID=6256 RepID=A0A914R5A6_PAREQ